MKFIFSFLVMVSCVIASCAQKNMYDMKDYEQIQRGKVQIHNRIMPYAIKFLHSKDSTYTAVWTYEDSTYANLVGKFYFKKSIEDGPFEVYANGTLIRKGFFKEGKYHGQLTVYRDGKVVRKSYYKHGVKNGVWEEFNVNGKLKRMTTYDESGNIIQDKIY